MNLVKRYPFTIIVISVFLYYLIMGILLPLNHDDWSWYADGKRQLFEEHFSKLNGRYLGNTIELIAVYIAPVRWLVYAGISLAVIWYLLKLSLVKQKTSMLLVIFAAVLIIPGEIFKQTYGWFAGFNNYVIGTLCVLIILNTIFKTIEPRDALLRYEVIIFYIACLAGQLFMENFALFNSFILFCAAVYYFYLNRKINIRLLSGFLLSFIGMLIMFSNPNYLNIIQGKSSYQSVAESASFISKAGAFTLNIVPSFIFFKQYFIITIITLLLLLLLSRSLKFKELTLNHKIIVVLGLVLLPLYRVLVYDSFNLETMNHAITINVVNFLVCLIFVVTFIYVIRFIGLSQKKEHLIYLVLFSMVFLHLPLMLVSPLGQRNFYTAYILWVLIGVVLVEALQFNENYLTKFLGGFVILFAVLMIAIFSAIAYTSHHRIQDLKAQIPQQSKKQPIQVTHLPFENLMQRSTPVSKSKTKDFKTYWNIPQDVKIEFVPYGTLNENKK